MTLDHNRPKSNQAADSYAIRPIQKAGNLLYRIFYFLFFLHLALFLKHFN